MIIKLIFILKIFIWNKNMMDISIVSLLGSWFSSSLYSNILQCITHTARDESIRTVGM